MTVTVTEEHIDLAFDLARKARYRWPQQQIEDLEDDALWGLYRAWATYLPVFGTDFLHHASAYIWWEMKHGLSRRLNRSRIAPAVDLTDTYHHPTLTDDQAIAQIEMESLVKALQTESQVVRDAVLRIDTDEAITRRHNLTDSGSVRQFRARFLRDYRNTVEKGLPYKSTARRKTHAGAEIQNSERV